MYRHALVQLSSPEPLPPDGNEEEEEEGAYPTLMDTSLFGSPILSFVMLYQMVDNDGGSDLGQRIGRQSQRQFCDSIDAPIFA